MSLYVCVCTNAVYMLCAYCIYNYVNIFEARSLYSTSHLKTLLLIQTQNDINELFTFNKMQLLSRKEINKQATNVDMSNPYRCLLHTHILAKIDKIIYSFTCTHKHSYQNT